MHQTARSFFLATVVLTLIAFLPFVIAQIGYFQSAIAGCTADIYAGLIDCIAPAQQYGIQRIVDIGFFFPFTFIFAGIPALVTGLCSLYFGIKARWAKV